MQYVSVRAVVAQLKAQFKIDMDIYEAIHACSDALKLMGSIALDRSIYVANIQNFCVNMPNSVWKVRGVVRLDGIPNPPMTITVDDIYFPPQIVFTTEEVATTETAPILFEANYVPQFKGPYIDYVWKCPTLKFNETDIPIAVECTGIKVDTEGFPMIPEPALLGCLYYALYVYHQPLFLLKQIDINMMREIERWKDQKIAQANQSMMMESLTSNERDSLFDIMTSMDRKAFGLPI
jgi:hypothetical protein